MGEIVGVAYVPMAQEPRRASELAVRASGVAPATLVESARTAMVSLAPDLPVRLQPATTTVARAGNYQRIIGSLLSLLALLGLGSPCWASTASSPALLPSAPASSASASR